jgi:hypothetical protein
VSRCIVRQVGPFNVVVFTRMGRWCAVIDNPHPSLHRIGGAIGNSPTSALNALTALVQATMPNQAFGASVSSRRPRQPLHKHVVA